MASENDLEVNEYSFGPISPVLISAHASLAGIRDIINLRVRSVTAGAHWRLCSRESDSFQAGHCNTGLRVYAGADVLCYFLLFCQTQSIELQRAASSSSPSPSCEAVHLSAIFDLSSARTVELGCGCGLSSLLTSYFATDVTLTDREESSLQLARANIDMLPPVVTDRCKFSVVNCDWSISSLTQMIQSVEQRRSANSASSSSSSFPFDFIIGTELLYFRVDLPELMNALKFLLSPRRKGSSTDASSSSSSSEATSSSSNPSDHEEEPVALLAHVNRLVNGDKQLLEAAANSGLTLGFVSLEDFMDPLVAWASQSTSNFSFSSSSSDSPSVESNGINHIIQEQFGGANMVERARGGTRNVQLVLAARSERALQRRFGALVPLSINKPVEPKQKDGEEMLADLSDDVF